MNSWTVRRGATVVHDDGDEHVHLLLRMLRIDATVWRRTLETYASVLPILPRAPGVAPDSAGSHTFTVTDRLEALARAYAICSPHAAPVSPASTPVACPICDGLAVTAVVARNPGPLVFGRCAACGHGILMSGFGTGTDAAGPYVGGAYYARRSETGVGYDDYEAERTYREKKGGDLLDRALALLKPARDARARTMLEVGSGFGFTRAAAERRGIVTAGVDVNLEAARAAGRIYGHSTFTGTLDMALRDPGSGIRSGAFDLVLYQFVLEHVPDPIGELKTAASVLAAGSLLVLLVPSMEAKEAEVFGASYRSFRADHLHLYSRDSIRRALLRAGLAPVLIKSGCNLDLLRGFLTTQELRSIYDGGQGPDLFIAAAKDA